MANASKTITINFSDATGSGPKDVTLTIKDVCTKAIIPGATVTLTINGTPQTQTADVNGQVTFAQVPAGEHALLVTAAGYLDSNADTLANDAITV
ncbi:carboxypeptidase regulatory-like domain-containing protein [Trichlorobacter lovleyi]|uniref:carboxypeptidase-like regulatory domain-containing protein n=1 Tax=Trichlorobacter lovleyi TaxID=313985 RepID=UPI00223F72C4|nr:carboxypeptidase-like regulatory domain-containing protein [Trichlorobacter lovleyi]QOX78717.1 carboxypeptidase regulatory-like domain-containing protein [Trichlorobacter lovleyi]